MGKYIVFILITIDILIAFVYLFYDKSFAKFLYWLSAASISYSTTLMK